MDCMKEDQTQLITARLEHLQFMMDSGKMPIFRHRSDMFLFALEAYNIARGLSSRYYRLWNDLDIRFFVRFQFDYWLQEIQKWIKQLGGPEFRVDDDDFFAEGRAKRLTIVVDRLFHYHIDLLPADSEKGSMPLPKEEILEPFKAVMDMKSTSLVESFVEALQEVYKYLLKLSMLPVEWPDDKRREALQMYLRDSLMNANVQTELNNYEYFCHMPDGQSVKSQFCYLKQRLLQLASCGELSELKLAKSDQQDLLEKLSGLFGKDETNPNEDQVPSNARPMADDTLFAKFLYFVDLDGKNSFPIIDEEKVSNYLIRKDVFLTIEQECNLQALFALMGAMQRYFEPILIRRGENSRLGKKMQQRVDSVMIEVKKCNSKLSSLLVNVHKLEILDTFFERLFSPEWTETYGDAQADLLELMEKDRDSIKLEPYIHLLRIAHNLQGIFVKKTLFGQDIHKCLEGEIVVKDVNAETVNSYWSKTGYKTDKNWNRAIKLVEAVEAEYKKK